MKDTLQLLKTFWSESANRFLIFKVFSFRESLMSFEHLQKITVRPLCNMSVCACIVWMHGFLSIFQSSWKDRDTKNKRIFSP